MVYKFISHTADVEFKAKSKSLEGLFKSCALATLFAIKSNLKVKEEFLKNVKIKDKNNETILYRFLEELVFLHDARDFITSKVKKLIIKDGVLNATLAGDKSSKYYFINEVKAITFNK